MIDAKVRVDRGEREISVASRPLGAFSDFVVEQLPYQLSFTSSGDMPVAELSSRVSSRLGSLDTEHLWKVFGDEYSRDLAGLDLKMAEVGLTHLGGEVPPYLDQLVNVFSDGSRQPRGLTYEELVLINPPDDRRTFTVGAVGETESAFYEAHRVIEVDFADAVEKVMLVIDRLDSGGTSYVAEATEAIYETHMNLVNVVQRVHRLAMQDKDHFAKFRRFLGANPRRQTKGPSGAFSAGVPIFEIYLSGESLPNEYTDYLSSNKQYFPRSGREGIDEARVRTIGGKSVFSLANKLGDPNLIESVAAAGRFMGSFRAAHYNAVKVQVPEAVTGDVAGTGGEADAGAFLRRRMEIRYGGASGK